MSDGSAGQQPCNDRSSHSISIGEHHFRFKFGRPDLNSKQLVAWICGGLFLFCVQQLTRTMMANSFGSNSRSISGYEGRQFLELTVRSRVTKFKSSRHFRAVRHFDSSPTWGAFGRLAASITTPRHLTCRM